MRNPRWLIVFSMLLVCSLAASAEEPLAPVEPLQSTEAQPWTPPAPTLNACKCLPLNTYASSVVLTGMGESCAEAEVNLDTLLLALGHCGGLFCDAYTEYTSACYMCTGGGCGGAWWKRDGKLRYKCEVCT
jgi:hypothetical protein